MMSENVKKPKLFHRIKYRNSVDPNGSAARAESFDANLKRRNRVIQYMQKVIAEKSLAKRRNVKVAPLRDIQASSSSASRHSINEFQEFCGNCPSTSISRFAEKGILKRVSVLELQGAHRSLLRSILEENRQAYLKVTHEAGIGMKLKSQGHKYQLNPYRCLGRTENYSAFLARRKELEGKFLLHYPLLKRILNECVTNLPYELFNLNHWLKAPLEFREFQNQFQDLANDSSQYLQEFYRKIVAEAERADIGSTQGDANYLGACTGLLSVNISRTIAHTLLHVVNFTASKEHTPYLKLNITFDDRLILEPTADDIVDIYSKFLQKLVTSAKQFYVLEKYKVQGYDNKHIYLCLTEEFLRSCIAKIRGNLEEKYEPILNYLENLEKDFVPIYRDISSKGDAVDTSDLIFQDGCNKILHYRSYLERVAYIPDNMYFPIGQLNLTEYREILRAILIKIVDNIFDKLSAQHEWENTDICEGFEIINVRATQKPTTTEEVIEIGKYMSWVKDEYLNELNERVIKALEYLTELIQLGPLTDNHMEMNARAINWIDKIGPILDENNATYEQLKFEAEEKLQRVIEDVTVQIKDVYPLLSILDAMDDIKNVRAYLNGITLHMVRIREIENQIEWINLEEVSLSFPKSTYAEFEELKNYVHPFYHLLKLCLDVQRNLFVWLDGQFDLINYDRTKVLVEKYLGELLNSQKVYRSKLRQAQDENLSLRFKGTVDDPDMLNWPAPLKLCSKAIKLIRDFEPSLAVIKIMCNEALMKRHWKEMSKVAGFDITPNAGTTLRKIIEIDLGPNIDKYEIISIAATREKELLEGLAEMQQEWARIDFELTERKQTQILAGLDRIESVSDRHAIRVIGMLSSIFVKPYEAEVRAFHRELARIAATLAELRALQPEILELSPVLDPERVGFRLRREIELLRRIRAKFGSYVGRIALEPNVREILDATPILRDLAECNSTCEIINAGIGAYFDEIRTDFPRLYFLTYPEMIRLHAKRPRKLHNQISKLFEAVAALNFDDKHEITSITNTANADFALMANVRTEGRELGVWLRDLETEIFNTLKIEIMNSVRDYDSGNLRSWISLNSCQTLLATSQINFTKTAEKALPERRHIILETTEIKKITKHFIEIITTLDEKLTNSEKIKLQSLIISNLYNEERLNILINNNINDPHEFKWISIFRYYLNSDNFLIIKIFDSEIPYRYEYLGDFNQVVLTPDTERCYHTIMAAYDKNLYSICEGGPGFDKFETIKSLANIFAIYLVKFPCSSQVLMNTLLNFLKGISSCGSWLCLENFDLLNREVCSLLAQELFKITAGFKRCANRIVIGSTEVSLKKCFLSIITNGPSESLPESLKVQLRCFKMPLPDYKMIAEVSLVSYGFRRSHSLSRLIVLVLQLCQQLSLINTFSLRRVKEIVQKSSEIQSSEEEAVLNSIRAVILPKIKSQDIPLFEKILQDSFPSYQKSQLGGKVEEILLEISNKLNLELAPKFCTKFEQLKQMSTHKRHIVVVGETLSGKSTLIKILHGSATYSEMPKVVINPIVSNLDELYGHTKNTKWIDGIIPKTMRDPAKKWLIFDGPVDQIWIENLTSVIDNEKLFLINGEVIATSSTEMILFEVGDLIDASPSLLSRCGVIYVDSSTINYECLVKSWLMGEINSHLPSHKETIASLLEWVFPPSLAFIRENCEQLPKICDKSLVKTFLEIFEMYLNEAVAISKSEDDFKNITSWIQACLVQASVWGLGGNLNPDSKIKFDEFTKHLWKNQIDSHYFPSNLDKIEINLPADGVIYDYTYVFKLKGIWKYLPDTLKNEKLQETEYLSEPFVPTSETVKLASITSMHFKYRKALLMIGPESIGKSLLIRNLLINKLDRSRYVTSFINLTVETTSDRLRRLILDKLDRYDLSHYSPRDRKTGVLFIDDLNAPKTRPPFELLRQFFDYNSWYFPDTGMQIRVHDLNIIAAMSFCAPNNKMCQRFLRHFNIFSLDYISEDSISRIYSTILQNAWKKLGLSNDIISGVNQIIAGTFQVYQGVKLNLKPIPSQKLYSFDLRNFSKVIQGCGLIRKESTDSNKKLIFKLWTHEVLRVFGDRLLLEHSRWLREKVISILNDLDEDLELIFENLPKTPADDWDLDQLIFYSTGSFLDEISFKQFHEISVDALKDFNKNNLNKLDIVLFDYALIHLSRICRALTSPRTNLLLIGLHGSGRESLVKLACQIHNQKFFKVHFTRDYNFRHWRNDIKLFLKEAAGYGRSCAVLTREEEFCTNFLYYEDLDLLLKSHEIPDLYESLDERQEIVELVRVLAQEGNKNLDISPDLLNLYHKKLIYEKLHLITCFNPHSKNFQQVVNKYPSIISYSDVDYLISWPSDGLETIAEHWLEGLEIHAEIQSNVVLGFSHFHNTVRNIREPLITTTTGSYLEFIKLYIDLVTRKQKQISNVKGRYLMALEKLSFASLQISEMQKSLAEYQPQLEAMTTKAFEMTKQIEKETIEVERASNLVKQDEKTANEQAAAAQILKLDCEADLAQAIPILEDAISALNTLKPTDITLVKSMKNPPDAIKLVMAAVCVIKDVRPDRIPDPSTGRKTIDYWGPSKRILGDMNFLQTLKDFDKDHIKPEIMVKIRKEYIPHKDFKPHVVAKASSAAEGLCKWIIAMDMYDKVAKEVAPKKEKLEKAEREYGETLAILNEKKEQVARIEQKLADLNAMLDEATKKQQKLQRNVDICKRKLERAQKLIGGLSEEKIRWTEAAETLRNRYDRLPGDILLASASIAYLGPFKKESRSDIVGKWIDKIASLEIPFTENFDLVTNFEGDLDLEFWNLNGLPTDSYFIDSAIIGTFSKRWCLFVDPQYQANRWIRKIERYNNLKILKLNSSFVKELTDSITFGQVVLVENIHEFEIFTTLIYKINMFQTDANYVFCEGNVLEVHQNFAIYLTTNQKSIEIEPKIAQKINVIDFILNSEALSGKLLTIVVEVEKPMLKKLKETVNSESTINKKTLHDIEEKILKILSQSKIDILEDEQALKILDESKILFRAIEEKQTQLLTSQQALINFRHDYESVASYAAVLYFCIFEFSKMNHMYQFSLKWFINLYIDSIQKAHKFRDLLKRRIGLVDTIIFELFNKVSTSIFAEDKLFFAFIIAINILQAKKEITSSEIQFLITPALVYAKRDIPMENPEWVEQSMWMKICSMSVLYPNFTAFLKEHLSLLEGILKSPKPEEIQLPDPWNRFPKLILIKIIRPDCLFSAISNFVSTELGENFITPEPFSINKSFLESHILSPIIFVLKPGCDPISSLLNFAKLKHFEQKLTFASIENSFPIIEKAKTEGLWVCIQNCHLTNELLPQLELQLEDIDYNITHENFRLWLSTNENDEFPVSLLERSVKVTKEYSQGLKRKLIDIYTSEPINNSEFYSNCPGKHEIFTRFLYSLSFFHCIIQERQLFGPYGWNTPTYVFSENDFKISLSHLQNTVNKRPKPLEELNYFISQCNYGGQIANIWDKRLLSTLLEDFLSSSFIGSGYRFNSVDGYGFPTRNDHQDYLKFINNLPKYEESARIVSLNQNYDRYKGEQLSNDILNSMSVYFSTKTCKHEFSNLNEILDEIKSKLPEKFETTLNNIKMIPSTDNSFSKFSEIETSNYLNLLSLIRSSSASLSRFLSGDNSILSDVLEEIAVSLSFYQVPKPWLKFSFIRCSDLGKFLAKLNEGFIYICQFCSNCNFGDPIRLGCFFNPASFILAIKLKYCQQFAVGADEIVFRLKIPGSDGVQLSGLRLVGGQWREGRLEELAPGVLGDDLAASVLSPGVERRIVEYECPMYRAISGLGLTEPSNFIQAVFLHTKTPPKHWIKRGVALFCQFDGNV